MTQITINLEELGEIIAKHIPPIVPADEVIWNADQCAAWLGVSKSLFLQEYAPLPKFPQSHRIKMGEGYTHPRWKAKEVRDWYFTHGEKVQIRRRTRKK